MLLLFSVFLYDTTVVVRDYFFIYGKIKNFTKIANGEVIDMCYQNGTLEKYYHFRDQYNYFVNYNNIIDTLM